MLNQAPNVWTVQSLLDYTKDGPEALMPDGTWQLARPYGYFSFLTRLSLAWKVFTGNADVLIWPNQHPVAY
jgi:hypothetical protein